MKSKVYAEVLRTQLDKSLLLLNQQFESEFKIEDKEFKDKDGSQVYGLMLTQQAETSEKRLWFRTYKLIGSKNDIIANALSELFDVMIGSFLVQASRTDSKTLENLSNKRDEV